MAAAGRLSGGAVDCDTHFFEPPDLWRLYLDPRHRSDAPRLIDDCGRRLFLLDGTTYPVGTAHAGLASLYLFDGTATEAVATSQRASVDVASRARRLAEVGAAAEIVYPTLGMMGHSAIRSPDLAAAHARAYNRFAAERAEQRVLPALIAPLNHPDRAIAEMEHACGTLGLRVLLVSAVPPEGLALSSPALDRVWAAAAALDLTVTIQDSSLSAGAGSTGLRGQDSWRLLYIGAHVVDAQLAVADLILGGVMSRHPELRVGLQETHLTWISSWLRLLDERFPRRRDDPLSATERFATNCFVSAFPDEPGVGELVDAIGPDNIVFASDWPHRELVPGTDPMWPQVVERRSDLSADTKYRALVDNPRRWFPAIR